MPSTTSSSVSRLLASSTVMTPSLPTFCIALAIISPIDLSPFEAIEPTCATSADSLIFFERLAMSLTASATARSTPRLRSIGFIPAATSLAPSRTIAAARTVAVVVPSPAVSLVFEATSRTICAPMFSNLSSSSISLATVTPSLVMRGAPNDLSRMTLRPLGPSVTFTALLRMSTPRNILSRASVENLTSFADISVLSWCFFSFALGDHAHDVGLLHDQELVAVELDLGARPFAEQHAVAGLDPDRDQLAVVVAAAGPDGDDLTLLRLLLDGVGNDDAALGLRLGVDTLDDHPVMERPELRFRHDHPHCRAIRVRLGGFGIGKKRLICRLLALLLAECQKARG